MERTDLFSKERAVRGAKVGAGVSLAVVGAGGLLSGVGSEIINPGSMAAALEFVYEHPTETLEGVGLYTGYFAAIGAAIDSFRPTSRLAERYIKHEVEMYKSIRDMFIDIKDGSQKAYNYLQKFDFSRIPFNLTRPDQSALRRKYLVTAPILGALSGTVLMWGSSKVYTVVENFMFGKTNVVTQTIADHPVEAIGGMAVLGLLVAGSAIAFQKD